MSKITINQLKNEIRKIFRDAAIESADFDARVIMCHYCGLDLSNLILGSDHLVDETARSSIYKAAQRRVSGEPTFRILGVRSFYGLDLKITPDTLDPRPDTEILVDAVLPFLTEKTANNEVCSILDLGTGSGAICLALLSMCESALGIGVDCSEKALAVAEKNAQILDLEDQFITLKSDWFDKVSGKFDIITSNPPYIKSDVIPRLDVEVRCHDPKIALDGGVDGLECYRKIACRASEFLNVEGIVAVEIGYDQKATVSEIFSNFGFLKIADRKDLGANDRVLVFSLGSNEKTASGMVDEL